MSSSLWTSILSLTISTGLLSAQSRMHITVKVGSRAVLPCDWRTLSTQLASPSPHVQWCTADETVFERRGAEMFQGEGYKDRADVPEDKLLEGNCSLVLKKVTHDDAGVYMSYLIVKRKNKSLSSNRVLLQTVELSVEAEKMPGQLEAAERDAGIIHTSSWITLLLLLNLLLYMP